MKIEQSIEDMVKKPLTPQQIADYKDRLNQADKYGKKLFKIWTLIILISLGLIALFFQYSGMSLGFLIVVPLLFALLWVVGLLFTIGTTSLKKYPTSLVVEGVEYIRGTTGAEFKEVDINENNLPEKGSGRIFYQKISQQGRKPIALEKHILTEITSF